MQPTFRAAAVAAVLAIVLSTLGLPEPAAAQSGAIAGAVTADRGEVRALRVKARDTERRIVYTVFTTGGRYAIYNLPAGTYDVQVLEIGFDSPTETVTVAAGQTATADLALTANGVTARRGEGGAGSAYGSVHGSDEEVELVEFDDLYPPGRGRDILVRSCFGCHGPDGKIGQSGFHRRGPKNAAGWRRSINRMFGAGPDGWLGGEHGMPLVTTEMVTEEDKEILVQYLTENFGPGSEPRELELDTLVRDEEALSQALYIEWEGPTGHDPALSPIDPGVVCLSGDRDDTIVCIDTNDLDPDERARVWEIPNPGDGRIQPHGIIIDGRGYVYWTELRGDHIGQLNPETGEIKRYPLPTRGGGAHTLRADSRGNIWYSYFAAASKIGRLDPRTGEVTEYASDEKFSSYGMTVDRQDRVWAVKIGGASTSEPGVIMYNQETGAWHNYEMTYNSRRLSYDAKGNIWTAQYAGNRIGMVDPSTNTVKEYEMPLKYGNPYEVMPGADDDVWAENASYNSLVRFNQETEEFTYFPFPRIASQTPKIEADAEGNLWFPNMGLGLVTLKPYGNVAPSN